jgi:AhpD family alkylhydroperoxidase
MPKLEVFDPPMCCSTGVCGPSVDPALPRFAADLDWLKGQGVTAERLNLAQQPGAFAANPVVKQALTDKGNDCLPLILVDGRIASMGKYPTRDELAVLLGITAPEVLSVCSPAVDELVAIAAAVASNCVPCLKYHTDKARALGVSDEDMARAVGIADAVKRMPAQTILELANRYLEGKVEHALTQTQTCCTPTGQGGPRSKCC